MDIYQIKQHLINNPEKIEDLLDYFGFANTRYKNGEYRCAFEYGTNATSIKINVETLGVVDFSRGTKGDIITLCQAKTSEGFMDIVKSICKVCGIEYARSKPKDIVLPFGGFYKKIGVNKSEQEDILTAISDSEMEKYETVPNMMFLRDGIDSRTQKEFMIGYDAVSSRITIPWWDFKGQIVGIMGRLNQSEIEDGVPKYFPVIPFSKSLTLYGYCQNYSHIKSKEIVMICESEKATMQMRSMGVGVGLSLGGNNVHQVQINNIHALAPKKIILGLDEGLEEEYIREQCKKLKVDNRFMKNKVGYIFDRNGEVLKRGSKKSPTDLGLAAYKELIKKHIIWI